jgi:hypothetical protein
MRIMPRPGKKKGRGAPGNGLPVEFRALGEAYHDACYAVFLKEIERILEQDPEARVRLDQALSEFRKAVLGKIKL